MAGVLLPISVVVGYYDNNLQKLAGGTINTYTAGTTTPINTYTDSTLGTSNGTSLTLDSNGRPTQEMWVAAGTTVKIIVKDSSGNQIGPTLDNISGLNDLGTTQNLGPFWGGSAGGTANALTLTFSSGPSAYQAGQRITFLSTATNSTAATVNVNGLGAKAIQNNTAALVGGEIINGNLYELEYTGTAFQVVAMPADPVTIKGAQTVTGNKTFSGTTALSAVTGGTFTGTQTFNGTIDGTAIAGYVIGYAKSTSTTADSTSVVIPADNTIPQITEGKEYLTVSYTPKYASSLLEVSFYSPVFTFNGSNNIVGALFRDSGTDAIAASPGLVTAGGAVVAGPYEIKTVVSAVSTTATTFRFRYGPSSAATAYMNQFVTGTPTYGAVMTAVMTVREIKQ